IAALVLLTLAYLRRVGIRLSAGAAGAALAVATLFNGIGLAGIDHPHLVFGAVYLPALLLAWEAFLAGRPRAAALAVLAAGVQWLPGYPEIPLATAVLLVVIAALGERSTLARRIAAAAAVVGCGALVAAAQIVPLAETVRESVRADEGGAYPFVR